MLDNGEELRLRLPQLHDAQQSTTAKDEEGDKEQKNCETNFVAEMKDGQAEEKKKDIIPISKKKQSLLQWKDMPKHLQFNPYIFTGYRPMLSFWGCLNSLFYIHNETINILTHGKIASLFFSSCNRLIRRNI